MTALLRLTVAEAETALAAAPVAAQDALRRWIVARDAMAGNAGRTPQPGASWASPTGLTARNAGRERRCLWVHRAASRMLWHAAEGATLRDVIRTAKEGWPAG